MISQTITVVCVDFKIITVDQKEIEWFHFTN